MPDRRYVYRVELDASQAAQQAAQVRAIFQRELGNVRFTPRVTAQSPSAIGGGSLPSFAPRAGGNRELIPGFGNIRNLAGFTVAGTAIGAVITQGARLAVQLDEEATAYKRVNVAALQLAGTQGNLTSLIKAYVDASGGAVDKATALQKVTELQAVGFADNAKEVERITRAARAVNLANPTRSVDYLLGQMQLAIANKSTMRLDQLSVGVSEFKAKLEELKTTMPQLSDEMQYQEALLQVIETKFKGVTDSAEAQATGVEQLRVAWMNLRLEMAQQASEVVDPAAKGAAAVLGGDPYSPEEIRAELEKLSGNIMSQAGGDIDNVSSVRRRMVMLNELNKRVQGALAQGVQIPQSYLDALDELTKKAVLGNNVTADLIPTFDRLNSSFQNVATTTLDTFGALEDFADSAAAARTEAGRLAEAQAYLNAQFAEAQKLLRFSYEGTMYVNLPKVGLQPAQVPGLPSDEYFRQLSITQGGGFLTPGGASLGDIRGGWGDKWRQENEEATRAAIREREQAEQEAIRNSESAWKSAASTTEQAFREAASELESKIRSIPGVIGSSQVTSEQMELAKLGVPQNFADDIRRRLNDEVLNKVDYADIDPTALFARAGIDAKLDPKAQLALFNQKWADSSLFANPDNLSLFNQGAIRAELERQRMSELGQQNILGMFGLTEDSEGAMFADLGGIIGSGLKAGADEGLAEFGRDAIANVVMQLKSDAAITEYANLGGEIGGAIWGGVINSAGSSDIVDAIVGEVLAQIVDYLPPQQ